MNEVDHRIHDIDKAWTAANAEDAFRRAIKEFYGNIFDPELVSFFVDTKVEERIADYNPEKEAGVDFLKNKAQQLANVCKSALEKEYGSMGGAEQFLQLDVLKKLRGTEASDAIAVAYRYLLDTFNLLGASVANLDMGIDLDRNKENIMEADSIIPFALQKIEELKAEVQNQ